MDEKINADKVTQLFKMAENVTDIRQQLVNLNYYLGNQWIGWNRATKEIVNLKSDGNIRVVRNRIRPRVMTLLSKHIKNKLKFDVIPASKEQSDIDAAKAADKFLNVLWNELEFSQKTRELFLYMLVQKRAWIKTWYDPEDGEDISPVPEDGEIFDDWVEKGAKPIYKGGLKAKVCDPLTVFADPGAKTEDEIRWIIERYGKDVDEIEEEYDVKVAPEKNISLSKYNLSNEEKPNIDNMALVYELWFKPCKKYPNGAMVTMCDGKIIYENYESGELPYQLFGYIPVPGSLLYDAIVTDLIDPQKEINVLRSMVANHARKMGNSIWLNPVGSTVDDGDLTNEISQVIPYVPTVGAKPERVPAPDIPSFYGQELAQNAIDIDDMGGAREISQGRLPAGLDTASGLSLMVEQENEKMSVASQNYEQGMKKVMKRLLMLTKEHLTEERQLKILGEGSEIEVFSFNGSDLTGYEDINIVQGSSLPELKVAQEERIMTMWGAGAIVKKDGTPDPAKLLRLMGMGDSTELFEQEMLDTNNAKLENQKFEDLAEDEEFITALMEYQERLQVAQTTGSEVDIQPPPMIPQIWDSDDHEVHVMVHNNFRKTSRYRDLPPEIRALVDQHYNEHLQMIAEPLQQQQQLEQQQQEQEAQEKMAMKQMEQQTSLEKESIRAQTQIAVASLS